MNTNFYNDIIDNIEKSILKINKRLDKLEAYKNLLEIGVKSINRKTCDPLLAIENEISYLERSRMELIDIGKSFYNRGKILNKTYVLVERKNK